MNVSEKVPRVIPTILVLLFGVTTVCGAVNKDIFEDRGENFIGNYPKTIWTFYAGPIHPIVQKMINKTRQTLSDNWTIFFLTEDNWTSFIEDWQLPITFDLYSIQNQADLFRLILLDRYGGWWIDPTTIVNSDRFMKNARSQLIQRNGDFYGFCWLQCPKLLIENNVMYVPRQSTFIHAWKDEYFKALSQGRENYIYETYRNGIDFATQLFTHYPYLRPYFTAYVAQQAALTRIIPRRTVIITNPAEDYIYKLMVKCDWEARCLQQFLPKELEPDSGSYEVTKVPAYNRQQVWPGYRAPAVRKEKEPRFRLVGRQLPKPAEFAWGAWSVVSSGCLITFLITVCLNNCEEKNTIKQRKFLI